MIPQDPVYLRRRVRWHGQSDFHRVETGSGIGFGATVKAKSDKASEGELLAQVEPEDLIKFGLIRSSSAVCR